MNSDRIEIRAHRKPWLCDTIGISLASIRVRDGRRTLSLAQPIILRELTEQEACFEQPDTFRLHPDEAQQFMDELWRVGIRPTEGAGSVGQLAATERHLEDMRTLVFKVNVYG